MREREIKLVWITNMKYYNNKKKAIIIGLTQNIPLPRCQYLNKSLWYFPEYEFTKQMIICSFEYQILKYLLNEFHLLTDSWLL